MCYAHDRQAYCYAVKCVDTRLRLEGDRENRDRYPVRVPDSLSDTNTVLLYTIEEYSLINTL